jgi:N-acetylglucosaminyl-diphospho-decaprenol L-rhamnosyltransferase
METRAPIDVSIIIVSYNTKDFIDACLRALAERERGVTMEVIVVDNASHDGSVEIIRKSYPDVRLVENTANLGYAKAVNQGMACARGRYFLVLNPDVEVTEGAVGSLAAFMDGNPSVGLAGAKLVYPDGTLQMSCRTFYTLRTVLLRRTPLGKIFPDARVVRDHLMVDWDHASEREVDWVLGACMMVRREAYESLGGMDERFFLYLEDVDWCYRMKKHGWTVYYVPSAVMRHHHRRESAKLIPDRQLVAHLFSTFRFLDKWNSAVYAMKRERWVFSLAATVASDLVLINLAFVLAYYLRYAARGVFTKPLYGLGIYSGLVVFVNVVCLVSLVYAGFYRRPRPTTFVRDLVGASRALLLGALVIMVATYLTRTITYSRAVILVFWPVSVLLVTSGRAVGRWLHRRLRAGLFDLRRAAIVGEDADALDLKARLLALRGGEYDFVGYVGPAGRTMGSDLKPVLGDVGDVGALVKEHRLHDLYVCDKRMSRAEIGATVIAARRAGAEVRVVSEVTDILIRGSQLEDIGGVPVIVFPPASLSGVRLATKRISDFCLALVGIVVLLALSPLALAAQALSHREYGRLGRSLKNLALVLRGKLSLIGPGEPVSGERLKPGVVGPWVGIAGLADDEKARLDVYYVQNWSLSYDLEILLEGSRRIGKLFTGSKADRRDSAANDRR